MSASSRAYSAYVGVSSSESKLTGSPPPMSRVSIRCFYHRAVDLLGEGVGLPDPFGHQGERDALGAGVGVQPGQPGPVEEGLDDGLAGAFVAECHAELGGGRRGREGADGTGSDLRVHPKAERGGGGRGGDQGVEPGQLLEVVGVDGDAEREGLAELGGGLGGGVEHGVGGRDPGGAREGQFAGAGDLGAESGLVEQAQDRHERGGLDGEGVQHGRVGDGGERAGQGSGGGADADGVEERDDRFGGGEESLIDGGSDGEIATGGGHAAHPRRCPRRHAGESPC